MASAAQVEANRANAQKSTGPRTAEGKTKVAQNAVKHGLLARAAVLQGEDPEEFTEFREQLLEELGPEGMQEAILAERIVSLSWRLQRAARNQNAAFEVLYDHRAGFASKRLTESDRDAAADNWHILGDTLVMDFANERVLERLLVYERRIESSLCRMTAELRRRRRERGAAAETAQGIAKGNRENPDRLSTMSGTPTPNLTVHTFDSALPTSGETPDGVTTSLAAQHSSIPSFPHSSPVPNAVDARTALGQTKPIPAGIELASGREAREPVSPCMRLPRCARNDMVGRGRPTYKETPDGVTTDLAAQHSSIPSFHYSSPLPSAVDARTGLRQTKPIPAGTEKRQLPGGTEVTADLIPDGRSEDKANSLEPGACDEVLCGAGVPAMTPLCRQDAGV